MRDVLNVWLSDGGSLQPGFISRQGRKGGGREERTKEEGGKDGRLKRQREGGRNIQPRYKGPEC